MRINNIENKFTFGIEYEGVFTRKLLTDLFKEIPRYVDIEEKADPSVNTYLDYSLNKPFSSCSEINVGVFKSFKSFKKFLAVMKKAHKEKEYFFDGSTGIHIHIAPKPTEKNYQVLRDRILDWHLLKRLQKYALEEMTPETRDRIEMGRWCKKYGGLMNTYLDLITYGEKYKFMRNHKELRTFEFRFFACSEPTKNIVNFFNFLFSELGKDKVDEREVSKILFRPNKKEIEPIRLEYKIPINKSIKVNYPLAKNKVIEGYPFSDSESERFLRDRALRQRQASSERARLERERERFAQGEPITRTGTTGTSSWRIEPRPFYGSEEQNNYNNQ